MFDDRFLGQARLLIRCLPEVSKQDCFALKGGTAINLFVRDMPRISIDIDLTYLPLTPRDESLAGIQAGLQAIAADIRTRIEGAVVNELHSAGSGLRLLVTWNGAVVKIEPNPVFRGALYPAADYELVPSAQRRFEAYVSMTALAEAGLYGSKICAALDRQHPRDLFDVRQMMETGAFAEDIRRAFVVYLAGHPRPMHELLDPRTQNIETVFHEQFEGMSTEPVMLEELVEVQRGLAGQVRGALTENEKEFLLSVKRAEPDWDRLGIGHLKDLPALRWKVMNVRKMDECKRAKAYAKLEQVLST